MNTLARPEASFAACYAEHQRRIYHLCLRYGAGDHGFAEDVTHDAFIKLLEHLPHLQDQHDLGAWLYRVATNLALSELRRRRWLSAWIRRRDVSPSTSDLLPDRAAEDRQAARRALETLSTLPPRERVVICMKLLDGKSQTEIAETLSLSEGYVSKLLARAWGRIRATGWDAEANASD